MVPVCVCVCVCVCCVKACVPLPSSNRFATHSIIGSYSPIPEGLQCVAGLRCAAGRCSVLECGAVCCRVFMFVAHRDTSTGISGHGVAGICLVLSA